MWKQRPFDEFREKALIAQGKSKLLSRLLAQRNVNPDTIEEFISSEYKSLSHPFEIHDLEKAVKIFIECAKKKYRVAVSSDYDCDGIIGATMIKELCTSFNLECEVFLPSRLDHGYGLSEKTVNAFLEKMQEIPELLFVIDCGTNSKNEIDMLRGSGIKKIIIIDHHTPDEKNLALNADALVSWHLSKTTEMCSCGEIFQFIRGIRQFTKAINPIEFLTYAAVGTIADVTPVIGDNRIIIKNGLTTFAINHVMASGLTALMKQSRILAPTLTQTDVAFRIAPKINAAGRIFQPDIVYGLMIERDPDIAFKLAEYIGTFNDERKEIQKKIEQQALHCVEQEKENFTHGILIHCDSWHVGVVGIVASKLVEEFNKPTIVVGKNGDIWKGSGRSIKGVNLKDILDLCPEIFEAYGGHAGAVGVTLKNHTLNDASKIFNEACKKYFSDNDIESDQDKFYDAKLSAKVINADTSKIFAENLYPYCQDNNSEPIFLLPEALITSASIKEGKGWKVLTINIEKDGVRVEAPFKMFSPKLGTDIQGRTANIYFNFPQHYEISPNKFNKFELTIDDIELL